MGVAFDIGVVALLISVAAWSIFARGAFSAIVIFMVYGLLLSLAWVRLGAVDVAMTEAAIGGGVTGMLLLNAAAGLRGADAGTTPAGPPLPLCPVIPSDCLLDPSVAGRTRSFGDLDPSASSEEVIAAAEVAGVVELVKKLPDGFNTRVVPGSLALSGSAS